MYEVVLEATGEASYVGTANVERLGHYAGQLVPNRFRAIADPLYRDNFGAYKEGYYAGPLDAGMLRLTIAFNGGSKIVYVEGRPKDVPEALLAVEAAIDSAADAIDWVKTE